MVDKPFEFPPYDPEKFPVTEMLLVLYDMATRWSDENGYAHRDNFRFASQYAEIIGQNEKLQQKEKELAEKVRQKQKELTEKLKEVRASEIILRAVKGKGLFKG